MQEAEVSGRWIAAAALLVLAGCFLGASADVLLTFPGAGTAILFPPYAIVTTALLRVPPRYWAVILIAASIGDFLPHLDHDPNVSFVLMAEATNHFRALLAAIGLRAFANARIDTSRGTAMYLVFAVVLAPCAAAFLGAAITVSHNATADYWLAWRMWSLSNALTGLTLLPLLMIDFRGIIARKARLDARRVAEAVMLFGGLLGVAIVVLTSDTIYGTGHPRLYLTLLFVLWAAVRFGQQGTSAALLAVTVLTIWGAVHREGPFRGASSPAENLLELQMFLLVISIPLHLLAALMREQRSVTTALSVADVLRDADRRKDEFLAMLGHELRSPLMPISVAVEILRKAEPDSNEAVWARGAIKRQLGHMTRLVDDLLDVSRVTAGKIRLLVEPLDLRDVVASAVDAAKPLVDASAHALEVVMPSDAVLLEGDSVRLAQIVTNLLSNATKYTERGGHIRVSVARDGDTAVITVSDNGIGIPTSALGDVFKLFHQVPSGGGHTQGGLGIGLTLVKQLVELHHGSVEARSGAERPGTEIIVRLPAPQNRIPERSVLPPPRPKLPAPLRVLVVDDNVDIADGLALILGTWQHDVRTANDGLAALEAANAFDPDIVLLDIGLPHLNGLEVAKRLRDRSKRVWLVMMSGFGPEQLRRGHSADIRHHLLKPLDLELLHSILDDRAAELTPPRRPLS